MMTNLWHRLSPRIRKTINIITIIAGLILILDVGAVIGFSLTHPTIPDHVDAIVVLGSKVGTPSLTQRTLTGFRYFQQGKTDTIVLSGSRGKDEPISETQAMADVIKAEVERTHGNMPHLILDTRSNKTSENLINSKSLIPSDGSIILVSDGFHMARSLLLAKDAGFQRVFWDSPASTYYSLLDLSYYYAREVVAIIVMLPRLI